MDKEIYLAVANRLKTEVPELKWIEWDYGQLNDEQPAISYPAALVDVSYDDCRNIEEGEAATTQRVNATVAIKLVFKPQGSSFINATAEAMQQALAPLDTVEAVHAALQGWRAPGQFAGLARRRGAATPRRDKLKVYTVTYATTFINSI